MTILGKVEINLPMIRRYSVGNGNWVLKYFHYIPGTFYLKNFLSLFLRERKRVSRGGAERDGRDRESQVDSALSAQRPNRNPEIMTQAEIKSQMLNRLSHPGVP